MLSALLGWGESHAEEPYHSGDPTCHRSHPVALRPKSGRPIIAELQANGVTSLRRIAKALNERGVPTMAGPGPWHHTQFEKLLARLKM
jgi:hypothetical protein